MIVLTHSYPQQWIQYGAPKSFWISGFFYPQGNQYLALYETYISTDACYSPFQKANGRYFSVLLLINYAVHGGCDFAKDGSNF